MWCSSLPYLSWDAWPFFSSLIGHLEAKYPISSHLKHLMWAYTFFSSLHLLIILASWIYIGCLAFPPPFVFLLFFFIKSPWFSWLILICAWGVFSCSSCSFGWGSSCCFTNCLVGHIEVRWPQVPHLKHFTCLSLSSSFIFFSLSMFRQPFARCPASWHR